MILPARGGRARSVPPPSLRYPQSKKQKLSEIIAIVEAKKQVRDPNVAREQARHYITEIAKNQPFQPFAFLTNGLETYFWDQQYAASRLVAGFFSLPDLERLLYHQNAIPLSVTLINRGRY